VSETETNIGDGSAPIEGDLEDLLGEITETIERAKSMPLSSSAIIGRDEVLELLGAAQQALPDELQRARRVLQDHEALRAAAQREAAQLLDEARSQAAHLVQRTEIVRQSRHEAERLVAEADAESRRIRHEAEDYVDRKLAAFEIVLDRTIRTVQAGRERLTAPPAAVDAEETPANDESGDGGLFDQDLR
jgi:cell division septum initiation protein DivIVA